MRMASHRKAPQALFWVSFAESSFFPIPPDAMLIPMVLANRAKAWRYAAIATAASVLGGIVGYAIGYFLYETLGLWLINLYGLATQAEAYRAAYNEWGLWIILIKGLTPIPYKLVTIASGAAAFNLGVFIAASVVTRGARFFAVAALLYWFGDPIREFVEKRLTLVTSAFVVALVGGFVVVKLLV
jgi:membrane protein YqaA with SNARE-associated domain